jgi:hypothetical protein
MKMESEANPPLATESGSTLAHFPAVSKNPKTVSLWAVVVLSSAVGLRWCQAQGLFPFGSFGLKDDNQAFPGDLNGEDCSISARRGKFTLLPVDF